MGSKGIVASTAANGRAAAARNRRHDPRLAPRRTPTAKRTNEVVVAQEILQTMGWRSFAPMVAACPGCGAHGTSTVFQELARAHPGDLRAQMPICARAIPGRVDAGRGDGLRRQRPPASRSCQHRHLASRHRRDAVRRCTSTARDGDAQGRNIAVEFQRIVDDYVRATYGGRATRRTLGRPRRRRPPARRSREMNGPHAHCVAAPLGGGAPRLHAGLRGMDGASGRWRLATPRPAGHSGPSGGRARTRKTPRALTMASTLNAVRGMNDVLPTKRAVGALRGCGARGGSRQYGYAPARPIVEQTPLFVRGIGDATDIVEHEMYTFEDKLNGESLTLRPEADRGIVRAAIEHSLTYSVRSACGRAARWFRHERPQRGATAISTARRRSAGFRPAPMSTPSRSSCWPAVARCWEWPTASGVDQLDRRCRRATRASRDLVAYLSATGALLDEDASVGCTRIRYESSIRRPRDFFCRNSCACAKLLERLPARRARISRTAALLDDGASSMRSTAARGGLDYYNGRCSSGSPTGSAHRARSRVAVATTACSTTGRQATPACGISRRDRTHDSADAGRGPASASAPLAYVVHDAMRDAPRVARRRDAARRPASRSSSTGGGGSFKSQMKKADASGARYALLIGSRTKAAPMR